MSGESNAEPILRDFLQRKAEAGKIASSDEILAALRFLDGDIELHHERQGTLDWKLLRATKITASELAGAHGEAKFGANSLRAILRVKRGEVIIEDNHIMKRGRDMEPLAREAAEQHMKLKFPPGIFTRGHVLASLDGYAGDPMLRPTVLEIKCPYSAKNAAGLPDHYIPQLAAQAWASDAEKVIYAVYFGGVTRYYECEGELLRVIFEQCYAVGAAEAAKHILASTMPDGDERDDVAWINAVVEYLESKSISKDADERLRTAHDALVLLAGPTGADGAGISVDYVDRAGNVDWKKIQKDHKEAFKGINIEQYRAKGTRYARINIKGE